MVGSGELAREGVVIGSFFVADVGACYCEDGVGVH